MKVFRRKLQKVRRFTQSVSRRAFGNLQLKDSICSRILLGNRSIFPLPKNCELFFDKGGSIVSPVVEIYFDSTAPHLKSSRLFHITGEDSCNDFLNDKKNLDKISPSILIILCYEDGSSSYLKR